MMSIQKRPQPVILQSHKNKLQSWVRPEDSYTRLLGGAQIQASTRLPRSAPLTGAEQLG